MLTLSQATADTKKILKIIAITIGAILSVVIIIRGIVALKEIISPTPPAPPTVSFGRLPKIQFPENATQVPLTYSINTVSGGLPLFPDRIIVNQMVGYRPDILAVDRANQRVAVHNFSTPGIRLSEIYYRWHEPSPLQREITMDVVTNDFVMTSLFLDDVYVLGAPALGEEGKAAQEATNFLSSMNLYPEDIDESKTTTTLFKIDNGALIGATSLSESQVIGVNFFQRDVNELPIFYVKADASTVSFLVGSREFDSEVVGADFAYQAIATQSATYPIKTAPEAFEDLKNGRGYISTYYGGEEIKIRDVFLAYYLGELKQDYLMPIIVFKGDDGFYAYVSAVRDEWLSN